MADKLAKRGVTVYIDGSQVKNSVQSISNEMNKLIREQKKMVVGSDEYVAAGKKIGQLSSILQQHRFDSSSLAPTTRRNFFFSLLSWKPQVLNSSIPKVSSYRDWETDRKSTRLNSSHSAKSRMPSSA